MNRTVNFNKTWEYSKVLTKIEIFGDFEQMRGLRIILNRNREFQKFERSQDFPKILTKIEIFLKFC